ncbi:MAG: hypothetical protein H6867_06360 [Rhodospirillales bacterium]|nr:hypothetical protein [Rhodospirillales bacterium]MCB9995171.1 hypothetical protein [Rhodospirillales bacterium]
MQQEQTVEHTIQGLKNIANDLEDALEKKATFEEAATFLRNSAILGSRFNLYVSDIFTGTNRDKIQQVAVLQTQVSALDDKFQSKGMSAPDSQKLAAIWEAAHDGKDLNNAYLQSTLSPELKKATADLVMMYGDLKTRQDLRSRVENAVSKLGM